MTPYTVYRPATGQILWSGACAEDDFEHQYAPEGAAIVELASDPSSQYFYQGVLSDIPAKPDDWSVWSSDLRVWQRASPAEILERQWSAIRARRDELLKTEVDSINAVRWNAMTPAKQGEWVIYRQALLDITNQSDPTAVIWPQKPD